MLSLNFLELGRVYLVEDRSDVIYSIYGNLKNNNYGFSETEYWMLFSRDFQSESGFTICHCCLRKMNLRDLSWHRCQNKERDEKIVSNRFKVIFRSLRLTRQSILFTILFLKRILGRDLAVYIGKLLYQSRYDFCLWYRSPALEMRPRRKVKKTRSKRLRDPKDFRWVL